MLKVYLRHLLVAISALQHISAASPTIIAIALKFSRLSERSLLSSCNQRWNSTLFIIKRWNLAFVKMNNGAS
ncbi:hypothetical protein [Fischerella thermalis]|uniref:hypothetical protein n=1 Tax=Fischerella thermalis TaxID=372787 RepID=UPI0011AF6067|nr:hypothetical protein [Fischerella thermalis]